MKRAGFQSSKFSSFKIFDSVYKHIATIHVNHSNINKKENNSEKFVSLQEKKPNSECPYFQGTSRSKTLYFISVSWSFISREASESVSLLHEVSLFNFWLNGYTYESLLDKGQSSQLYLTPIGLPGKISQ